MVWQRIIADFQQKTRNLNSIVYIQNSDDKTAYYGTYNTILDAYTKQIFNTDYSEGGLENADTKSKYNTRFKFAKKTSFKNIENANLITDLDTIIGSKRFLELTFYLQEKLINSNL